MISRSEFKALCVRARGRARFERDPGREAWLAGYVLGLMRGYHGESYGTEAEHEVMMACSESPDVLRAARGRGYRAGLALEWREPEGVIA
jgi:hypothetical protein